MNMSEAKTRSIIEYKPGKLLRGLNYSGRAETPGDWIDVVPGKIRYKQVKIGGVDQELVDAADIEMKPDSWSPFQCIASESTFIEVPHGNITFITADPAGNVYWDEFDAGEAGMYSLELGQGWIMVMHAHKNQPKPVKHLEYCEPGFFNPRTRLVDFQRGTSEIEGHNIPEKFWQYVELEEKGLKPEDATTPNDRQ